MTASPALVAVLADVLWCLGLGCLLGALRDLIGLALGNGPVRCFCWDLLAFAGAAVLVSGFSAGVSASGLARWYMAASLLGGVLAWQQAMEPAVHRFLRACLKLLLWPLRLVERRLLHPPSKAVAGALAARRERRSRKKLQKAQKNRKKQLQKPSKVLYN